MSGSNDVWPCKIKRHRIQAGGQHLIRKKPPLCHHREVSANVAQTKTNVEHQAYLEFLCLETGGEFIKVPKEGAAARRAPWFLLQIQLPFSGLLLFTSLPHHSVKLTSRTMKCFTFLPLPSPGSVAGIPTSCLWHRKKKKEGNSRVLGTCSVLHTSSCGITKA